MDPELERELRRRAVATRQELAKALGISQPTFSRMVGASRDHIAVLGRARATRYALRRNVRGLGAIFPLYRIDEAGQVAGWGEAQSLEGGKWWAPDLLGGPERFYDGFPYYLADLRPQGFMGRAFPLQHSDMDLPQRISDWNEDDIVEALASRGNDLMGSLILGRDSLHAYYRELSRPLEPVLDRDLGSAYPKLAAAAMAGDPAGSSAGGEQPKFAVFRQGSDGDMPYHVLVKFSPEADGAVAERWRDLLIAEHIALTVLEEGGVAASASRLHALGGRLFLEMTRFDRCGARGRRCVVTLGAVDDEFYGRRDNWIAAAGRLERDGFLDGAGAETLRVLDSFGGLIGNTDRHFVNITFLVEPGGRITPAPAYDQLPMRYAPSSGQLVERPPLAVEFPEPAAMAAWRRALPLAEIFWDAVAHDDRISPTFRAEALANSLCLYREARPALDFSA